jgi:hypothetical protein
MPTATATVELENITPKIRFDLIARKDNHEKPMKAAIVHSFDKPLVIEDVPKPTPGSGEIVVKNKG